MKKDAYYSLDYSFENGEFICTRKMFGMSEAEVIGLLTLELHKTVNGGLEEKEVQNDRVE